MREVARAAAFVVGLLVIVRDVVVTGGAPAMYTASALVLALLVGALTLWRDGLVTVSGIALACHYAISLGMGDVVIDLAAPFDGALILLHMDLADLAASVPPGRRVDKALLRGTLRGSAVLVGAATLTGAVTFAFATGPWPSAEWMRTVGVAGAGLAVLVPLILVRRSQ